MFILFHFLHIIDVIWCCILLKYIIFFCDWEIIWRDQKRGWGLTTRTLSLKITSTHARGRDMMQCVWSSPTLSGQRVAYRGILVQSNQNIEFATNAACKTPSAGSEGQVLKLPELHRLDWKPVALSEYWPRMVGNPSPILQRREVPGLWPSHRWSGWRSPSECGSVCLFSQCLAFQSGCRDYGGHA